MDMTISKLKFDVDSSAAISGKDDLEKMTDAAWILTDALDYLKDKHGVSISFTAKEE